VTVLLGWPTFALACGLGGLLWLLLAPRPAARLPRWRDPAWLLCLMLPVYVIHQFEEHGVDLLGRRYHFLAEMCAMLGHPSLAQCPADPTFIFAVNVGAVWIAGLCAVRWRRSNPMVGACAWGIPLVNGIIHVGPAIARHAYNSGLLTGALVFVPLSVYVLRTLVRAGLLDRRRVAVVIASGVAVHAILMGALLAYASGLLPRPLMLLVQVANGFVPLVVGTAVGPRPQARQAATA
jgi:hypothetical protein